MSTCYADKMDLAKEFHKYSLATSQENFQAYLEGVLQEQGLPAVLSEMFDWAYGTGYIDDARLNDNLRFEYSDQETGVIFRTQINYARSNYTPKPLNGKDIPKLHCPICFENIGIPGKENLRVFELEVAGRDFFIQLTPFPLFRGHYILISRDIRPMLMARESVEDLTAFVDMCPSFTACSNSDVEWAGASILSHHHYQVFDSLELPVMQARTSGELQVTSSGIGIRMLDFPIACTHLNGIDKTVFTDIMGELIGRWKAKAPGRNTCNLVVYKKGVEYHGIIIYRNPDFRTPVELTQIKSEGVGIIEVAGEGIYPVPEDEKVLKRIEYDGLEIIKGIISGNNPVKVPYKEFFKSITSDM